LEIEGARKVLDQLIQYACAELIKAILKERHKAKKSGTRRAAQGERHKAIKYGI